MLEQLIELDKDLFVYLNGLGSQSWDGFWMFYTSKWNWIPLYALICYLLYKKLDLKAFVLTLILVVLLVTFTDQISGLFKRNVMRPRPCYDEVILKVMRLVKSSCGGKHGYFSGHASNSMGLAVFLGLILKSTYLYILLILIMWAVLMAYSRIYVGVHYPLDIITGMVFGALSGWLFYRLFKYLNLKFRL